MTANLSLYNIIVEGLKEKAAVLSFEILEGMGGDDYLSAVILTKEKRTFLNKKVNFTFFNEYFNGIVTDYEVEKSKDFYSVKLYAKAFNFTEKNSAVHIKTDLETLAGKIAKCKFNSFYDVDFKIQYKETDLEFLQRMLETHNCFGFVKHGKSSSEMIAGDNETIFKAVKPDFVKSRIRNENLFLGISKEPIRVGNVFGDFVVCSALHKGSQEAAFGIKSKNPDGYSCQVAAYSRKMLKKLPKSKEKPQIPGVIVAKIEGFSGSSAALDSEGRYIVNMPFDKEKQGSCPIHLMQNHTGVHFGLRKDTKVLIAFEDGDIDKPVILGALPEKSVVSKNNSYENVLETPSGIKLTFNDSSGSLEINSPGRLILKGATVEIN